jgi:hypothetical protein
MELGGPAALEVRDRYGEAIGMLGRVALWLGKNCGKCFSDWGRDNYVAD